METEFNRVCKELGEVTKIKKLSDETMLQLYSFYKQATVGDCNTKQPSMFNLRDRRKWDAWNNVKGLSMEEAMARYIEIGNALIQK